MRNTIVSVVAVALAASTIICRAQESAGTGTAGKRLPIIKKYAAQYPEIDKKWMHAIGQEDPQVFIDLLKQKSPRIQDSEGLTARNLLEIYVQSGMSPWIAFAEEGYPGTPIVPAGKLFSTIHADFSTFMDDIMRTAEMLDVAVKPPFPHLLGDSSKGWMPGRTDAGEPVIEGWIDQSVWIRIPNEAEPGPVDFTVFLLTEGSQDGSITKKTEKREHKIEVVAPPKPTRENLLCLWTLAVESGRWLSISTDRPEEERSLRRKQLVWVDFLLKEFSSDEHSGKLAAALREREEYVEKVLSYLDEKESGDTPE